MSMRVTVRVGGMTLARVVISRVTNTGQPVLAPDVVSTYQVELNGRTLGTVEHAYGAGRYHLLAKAFTLIDAATRG